jgi:hypothetical protein
VLECGNSKERGGVELLVECRGAETLLARGYVTGFVNQAVVEGFLDQVIIKATTLDCETLFEQIRTLRANLNRMDLKVLKSMLSSILRQIFKAISCNNGPNNFYLSLFIIF